MASQFNARIARFGFPEPLPADSAPRPDRLDRLRELRATIDSLRSENEGHDPLLAWIVAREGAQAS